MSKWKHLPCPTRRSRSIEDAKKPLSFIVQKNDVVGSRVGVATECAAACALVRQTGAARVWVKKWITVIQKRDGHTVKYSNPVALAKGVDSFDRKAGRFPEGEYILRPLESHRRKAAQKSRNKNKPMRHHRVGSGITRPVYIHR